MRSLLSTLLLAGISATALAQDASNPFDVKLMPAHECGFNKVLQKAGVKGTDMARAIRHTSAAKTTGTTQTIYDIPVVVHVVYSAAYTPFNLPDSVIINQIEVLNKAYRMQHDDTGNTRSFFKPLAGDAGIQFHLATVDPQGNPTTGITRTESPRRWFGSSDLNSSMDSMEHIKHTAMGGEDAWPTNRYLNIWIGNLSDEKGHLSILGYAVPPLNPMPSNWPAGAGGVLEGLVDGVVLQVHAVGSNNVQGTPLGYSYTKGRCAVHEVGHYLGLMHTFGSSNGQPGSPCDATMDDGIDDTPDQSVMSQEYTQNPTCPDAAKNSCGTGTGDMPDMWENYMDYSKDLCQNMFTHGQINIMRSVMTSQRVQLTWPTAVRTVPVAASFAIYPNPAANELSIAFAHDISSAAVYNFTGQRILQWNGAAANNKSYDISALPAGNYVLAIESEGRKLISKFAVAK